MLFHNQSFEERLKFLQLNLCDFPIELSDSDIHHTNPEQVISGLKELYQVFSRIYAAPDVFQEEDPLDSLHNVTNSLMLLYSAGVIGELCRQGAKWHLNVDKKLLRNHYKQPMNKPMETLQQFGFYYEYYKGGRSVETLNNCTQLDIYCMQGDNVLLALNYILQRNQLDITDDSYTRMQGLFYKLDYRSLFLKESTKRAELNPFRADIRKTAGVNREFYVNLVEKTLSNYPLKTKIKLHEYYTPHWILQFYTAGSDKYAFNLNAAADTVCLEIRLSIDTVEALAAGKNEITGQLRGELDKLGCISCNKQCKRVNIKETNGVSYCTSYSEARLLTLYISSDEDVTSALMIFELENKSSDW